MFTPLLLVISTLSGAVFGYPASTIVLPIWPGEQVTQGPINPITPRQTAEPTYNTPPPSGKCSVTCRKQFEYLADPCNCECFYQCTFVGKTPTHYKCPTGLRWNTRSMACDHMENVRCTASGGQYVTGGGVYTGVMGATNGAGALGNWNAKLCCDGDEATQQVIQGSGSWGSGQISVGTGTRQVPAGSASRQVPVYPQQIPSSNYGTKQVPSSNYGGTRQVPQNYNQQTIITDYQQQQKEWWNQWKQTNTGNTRNVPSGSGTRQVPAGSGAWSGSYNAGGATIKGVCSDGKDGIRSHPSDCKKFVSCVGGKGIERVCPAGLTFDSVTGNCEWPEKASCGRSGAIIHNGKKGGGGGGGASAGISSWSGSGSSGGSGTRQTTNWSGAQSIVKWTGQSHLGVGIQTGSKKVLKGVCLTASDGIMPHPSDCSKFVGCTGGVGFEFLCPGGLKFDSIKGVCEWPEAAVCGKAGTYVNWSVGGGNSGGGGSGGGSGTRQTQTGSSSYAWSSSSSSSSSSSGETKSTIWGGQKAIGISSGVSTGKPVLKGVCPSASDGIKPHTTDCRKFIACTGGDGVEFLCPGGLHFDAPKGICNWPAETDCRLGTGYIQMGGGSTSRSSWSGSGTGTRQTMGGSGTRQTGNTKTRPVVVAPTKTKTKPIVAQRPQPPKQVGTNTATKKVITSNTATQQVISGSKTATKQIITGKEGICPKGFIGSLGHPTSCAKFYKCDKEGLAYEHTCPDNLLFDVNSKNCNWPEEVKCLLGGGGGGGGGAVGTISGQATQQVLPPKQTNIKQTQTKNVIGTGTRQVIGGIKTSGTKQVPIGSGAISSGTKQVIVGSGAISTGTKQVPVGNTKTKQVVIGSGAILSGTKQAISGGSGTKQVVTGGSMVGINSGKPIIKGVCPAGQIGRFPHATDCSKFIMCANEEGHEFSCPSGLLYDPPTKDCTWPEKANCRPTGIDLRPMTMPPLDKCVGSACDCPPGMIGVQPFCMPNPNAPAIMPTPVVPDRCRGEGCRCPIGMIGVEPFCMPDPNLSHGGEVISTDGQNIKGGISYAEISSNLMVDVVLTAYITSTSTGGRISHPTDPVEIKLRPHPRGGVNVTVVAPLMDSPRGGPPNCLSPITPCVDLPGNYESLSVVFLSQNREWALELTLGAHGHYVIQLFDGYAQNFTFNLPIVYKHSIFEDSVSNSGKRWRGEARIPTSYLPPVVTKFNAFYTFGSGSGSGSGSSAKPKMVLESLFPATESTIDARGFNFFQPLNMAKIDPENWKGAVPKIWKRRAQ